MERAMPTRRMGRVHLRLYFLLSLSFVFHAFFPLHREPWGEGERGALPGRTMSV